MSHTPERRTAAGRKARISLDAQKNTRDMQQRGLALATCPGCGKRAYTAKAAARSAARRLFPGEPVRAYECGEPRGAGFFHFTSSGHGWTAANRDGWILILPRDGFYLTETDAAVAARWVAAVVAHTGTGPTWGELADAMDWPPDKALRKHAICRLAITGWLITGRRPRSLRPGPLATPDDDG